MAFVIGTGQPRTRYELMTRGPENPGMVGTFRLVTVPESRVI